MTDCVVSINESITGYVHRWASLRVDVGSVEDGQAFLAVCHQINVKHGLPGIKVLPANVAEQKENMVERIIQTLDNMGPDLLGHHVGAYWHWRLLKQ